MPMQGLSAPLKPIAHNPGILSVTPPPLRIDGDGSWRLLIRIRRLPRRTLLADPLGELRATTIFLR